MKKVQILGPGCPKCVRLAENVEAAVGLLDAEFDVEKVTNIEAIMSFGVMMTPALVIDGEVKVSGKVPTIEQIKELLG